uniref:PDZ domain-containing protein n=1 Tax=Strongyloides stercoralis TaxID=6248 RepID=A0AAF5CXX2_STRER
MQWTNNLDNLNLHQKICEKDKIIQQKDIHIQHLTVLLEFQKDEIEDYRQLINSVEDQKNELEEKENIIEKLNEYKDILLAELQDKIEECTKNEQEIKKLNVENENLKVENDKILERYENCKFLLETKPSFDETIADAITSSDCSNSKLSSYEFYMNYDDLTNAINQRDSDIYDLRNEVECLRSSNKRMHSEMSFLKNELEELNNESYLKMLLNPNLRRSSIINLPSITEEQPMSLAEDMSIAIEIPETFELINQTSDNDEFYKAKILEMEKQLLESNQKLQEAIEQIKNHKCQIGYIDDMTEDDTQSLTTRNDSENCFINLKDIKKIHKDEINMLEEQIESLKAKLTSLSNEENYIKSHKKDTHNSINPFIFAIDYILSIITMSNIQSPNEDELFVEVVKKAWENMSTSVVKINDDFTKLQRKKVPYSDLVNRLNDTLGEMFKSLSDHEGLRIQKSREWKNKVVSLEGTVAFFTKENSDLRDKIKDLMDTQWRKDKELLECSNKLLNEEGEKRNILGELNLLKRDHEVLKKEFESLQTKYNESMQKNVDVNQASSRIRGELEKISEELRIAQEKIDLEKQTCINIVESKELEFEKKFKVEKENLEKEINKQLTLLQRKHAEEMSKLRNDTDRVLNEAALTERSLIKERDMLARRLSECEGILENHEKVLSQKLQRQLANKYCEIVTDLQQGNIKPPRIETARSTVPSRYAETCLGELRGEPISRSTGSGLKGNERREKLREIFNQVIEPRLPNNGTRKRSSSATSNVRR